MEKFRKKIFKSTKGITLIALVVTIIVLLILAGVSIAMLTGNNGILTQGKKAKEETTVGHEKEAAQMAYTGAKTKKLGEEVTAEDVNEQLTINGENATATEGNNKIIVTFESGKKYIIDQNGNITQKPQPKKGTLAYMYEKAEEKGCTNSDGSCTNAEHLHIGDYVDYNPLNFKEGTADEDKTASSLTDENGSKDQTFSINTDTKWRVLGEDDNGQILIVSADPVKKDMGETNDPYFYLKGAKGYINAETELEKISKIYGHGVGATEARSLKIEDVNKICGVTVGSDGLTPVVDMLGNFGTTQSYTDQYASPEDYLAGTKSSFSKTSNAYGYEGNNSLLKTATNTRAYETIFFKKQANKNFWLASRSVYVYSGFAGFCVGYVDDGCANLDYNVFDSNGSEFENYDAVRPVVSLKSDVTTDIIPKIADQEEQDWSGFSKGDGGLQ